MKTNKETDVHPIDAMPFADLFRGMVSHFGMQRTLELVGWVTVAGLISEVVADGNPATLRREMLARGMTQAALYRALADLREFGQELEGVTYPAQDHRPTVRFLIRLSGKCVA
jgi:hypothetical protein